MKKLYFALVLVLVTSSIFAQYGYRDSNRIGVTLGANQLSLNTDNFQTKPELGWNAGLSVRGNFYDMWDMVYSLQFSENNFSVPTKKLNVQNVDVNYKLASAQISLQLSYILVENHLSVEFGPIVQVNGKFKIDPEYNKNTINGTTLLAEDIIDISKFNFYPTIGITAGVRHFRFNVSYQYGINNMLGNLNTKDSGINFKGHAGIINGNIIVYL
ncbi:outer membrane beta-barrel protein [Flavobacterium hiemivividum]|uniref:PorT family protein n=1 Tax=Flavobacterium hiemivividum TaxID=2541734 RepID=A0A4R5D477_9FLAO|nr:outer membrane beta-barrel protein [Flavobacterium hiemivividum]TDE04883.1 PorT family protein [Flavobacterium hiemivividum]